jgi:DNA-binding CsgD family transcriptional regulator
LADYGKTVGSMFDAVLDERLTSIALEAVADFVGASSITYMLVSKFTRRVSTSVTWGSFTGSRADYLVHYSKIDPFLAMLKKTACSSLTVLSERLPDSRLCHDEWYNDFTLRGGTRDLLGSKLHESPSHIALIGLHRAIGEVRSTPRQAERLQTLIGPLCNAAGLHVGLVDIGYRSAIGRARIDNLAAGAIFTGGDGRIIDANQAGEQILRAGDGLTMRNGKISARRSSETAKLARLIADAAAAGRGVPSSGCMLIARDDGHSPYVVRVAPVGAGRDGYDLPMAMLVISSTPDEDRVSPGELAELYGLSPAESRIALALSCGKKLPELVGRYGVQITTLRTQLSSILRKCGVARQSDLVRLISTIPPSASPQPRPSGTGVC